MAAKQSIKQSDDARTAALLSVAIVFATLIAYWRVFGHDFLVYDDPSYVTQNPTVLAGLSWAGTTGAFTEIVSSNWQPVTVLSHQLDVTLFGLYPGGHHATSIFLHCANAVLLLLVLRAMTGELQKSAFVAALFALHPQHVESVAWIAERKDVLSAFFMFLALLAYARFVRARTTANYLLVALPFALGLMAKSMLVTLPPLLLVLDCWPLKRIDFTRPAWRGEAVMLVREKLPLFALTVLFSIVAVISQRTGGALLTMESISLFDRTTNAVVSYAQYALSVFWPHPLAIFYPHPGAQALWKVVLALVFIVSITLAALRLRRSRPYLLMGWLWYLGTLVPVIGIVQVGVQAMADRYAYITTVGLFAMITWGTGNVLKGPLLKAAPYVCCVILAAFSYATARYAAQWATSETIFRHALDVTKNNFPANVNLGIALAEKGELAEAVTHFEAATRIVPTSASAWFNLGTAYLFQEDYVRAAQAYAVVVETAPNDADAHARLGESLFRLGRNDVAAAEFKKALEINPNHAEAAAYLQAIARDQ